MIRLPQRLPDPTVRWWEQNGTLSREAYQYQKELDQSVRSLIRPAFPVPTPSFAVASLPDAALYTGAMIFVSDEAGGAVTAFSDGTNWRRVTDRTIVS